jgi:hypothetical protein
MQQSANHGWWEMVKNLMWKNKEKLLLRKRTWVNANSNSNPCRGVHEITKKYPKHKVTSQKRAHCYP